MGASFGTGTSAGPGPISPPRQTPSHIYRPTYQGQGLGATPQASMYRPSFSPQMPTYTRPSAPMQAPQQNYRVPYSNLQRRQPTLFGMPINALFNPTERTDLAQNVRSGLNFNQYQMMMANPRTFLPFVKNIQQEEAQQLASPPQRPAIPYMTEAQAKSYNQRQALELGRLLGPAPADPNASDGGG